MKQSPIINVNDFPALDNELLEKQELERRSFDYRENNLCYVYIREHNKKNCFLDIYFYHNNYEASYVDRRRFIIAPGSRMEEVDERCLVSWLVKKSKSVVFVTPDCDDFIGEMSFITPEIHLKSYTDIGMALFHIYFASFKSGIKELLLKASLEWIALDITFLDDWDFITFQNIETAFNMPLPLLRKFNYSGGIKSVLSNTDVMSNTISVYKRYHSILNDIQTLNEFQILYLKECLEDNKRVDKKLLKELSELQSVLDCEVSEYVDKYDGYEVYEKIKKYRMLWEKVNINYRFFKKYPSIKKIEEVEYFNAQFNLIQSFIGHEDEFDQKIKKYACEMSVYRYQNEEYVVLTPQNVKCLIDETEYQHNYLIYYIMEIINGNKTVIFMRDKKERNKPLITILINKVDGTIEQAKGRCNRSLSEKECDFIEKYAKEKKLEFNKFLLDLQIVIDKNNLFLRNVLLF